MGAITVNAAKALALAQAAACERIDAMADKLCAGRVTPGFTQQARYARKLAQAKAFLQDGTPTEAEYPLIYNEVGLTAETPGAVAMAIVQAAESYATYCDTVEVVRMRIKAAIKAAADTPAVAAIEAAVVWPEG